MMNAKLIIIGCLLSIQVIAQKDEVQLIGVGNRSVEPAYRMTESPRILDTSFVTKVPDYPLLALQYPTMIQLESITPATIKTEPKLNQLYPGYVKLGIGSELMPLGEVYFDSKRSRKYVYGIHIKHLSSFGNFKNYAPAQFDRTRVDANGSINEKDYTAKTHLYYSNQGLHYYGWEIPTDSVDRKTIAQRYQHIGGAVSYASHQKDSSKFNYEVGLEYSHFNSKKPLEDSLFEWRARENQVNISGKGTYRFGKEVFGVDLGIRYNGYRYGNEGDTLGSSADSALVVNNTIVNLKPHITTNMLNNRFKALVGLDLVLDANEVTRFYVFPTLELKYSLFNDLFIPYVGLRGGVKQTSFRSLTEQNEFILSNVTLRNENTTIDFYGGFKGTLSKKMSFHVGASFARIKDKAFFVTDTLLSVGNKFNVLYDTLNLTTIEGSLSYQLNEKLKVDAIGRYYSYALLNNAYAWNMPDWQATVRGNYNLFSKFVINLDLNFEGGRKALVYTLDDDVIVENLQYAKPLGLIADINLGLEYRYNKRLSAFIQFNNVASQRYNRWYNYPVQVFQVLGGITARF
jgi:hypothetical protein